MYSPPQPRAAPPDQVPQKRKHAVFAGPAISPTTTAAALPPRHIPRPPSQHDVELISLLDERADFVPLPRAAPSRAASRVFSRTSTVGTTASFCGSDDLEAFLSGYDDDEYRDDDSGSDADLYPVANTPACAKAPHGAIRGRIPQDRGPQSRVARGVGAMIRQAADAAAAVGAAAKPMNLPLVPERSRVQHQQQLMPEPPRLTSTAPARLEEQPLVPETSPVKTPPPDASPADPQAPPLCPEQRALVDLILSGRNVFYTGSAGCGKSTVLRAFVGALRERGKVVKILAPTGRAALDVGGSTTWTYAAWKPDDFKCSLDALRARAAGSKRVRERFFHTDVLVIDEISMVENLHLERLNHVMRAGRGVWNRALDAQPFGGVQVVLTGDFCQLPPVKPFQFCLYCGDELVASSAGAREIYTCPRKPRAHGPWTDSDKWAFKSTAWREARFEHVHLHTIHRQAGDLEFIRLLQKCRLGIPFVQVEIQLLMSRSRPQQPGLSNPMRLYSTREEVAHVNTEAFERLQTPEHRYPTLDSFAWKSVARPRHLQEKEKRFSDGSLKALAEHRFERFLKLKKGMPVVLLANLDLQGGLCNGSQGIICGFEKYDPAKLPKRTPSNAGRRADLDADGGAGAARDYSEDVDRMVREFCQARPDFDPSTLEFPVVIFNPVRGCGTPRPVPPVLELEKVEESGEALATAALAAPAAVVAVDGDGTATTTTTEQQQQPLSNHELSKGTSSVGPVGITRTIYPECQVSELGGRLEDGRAIIARTQIPLAAAWAMSIHKSQGMTLSRVVVDLSRAFEEGQVYVALSRATSLDGLRVQGNPEGLRVGKGGNADVRAFLADKFGPQLEHMVALE